MNEKSLPELPRLERDGPFFIVTSAPDRATEVIMPWGMIYVIPAGQQWALSEEPKEIR